MVKPMDVVPSLNSIKRGVESNYTMQDVLGLTGYSTRSAIWKAEKQGRFPRRIKIGEGRNGRIVWDRNEVDVWLNSRRYAA